MLPGHPIFTYMASVTGLRFIDGGRRLVSAGWDGALRVWDTTAGSEIGACHTDSKVFGLAVDATERWALTGPKMGAPRLWDLTRVGDVPTIPRHGAGVTQIVALDERALAVTGGAEAAGAAVRLWRVSDGALEQTLAVEGNLMGLAVAPDAGALQVLDDGGVSSWSLAADGDEPRFALDGRTKARPAPEWNWSMTMSPGVAVGIGFGYPDNKFLAWRAPAWRGRRVGKLRATSQDAALSGDGRLCVVHAYDTNVLQTFDVQSGDTRSIALDDPYRTDTSTLVVSPSGAFAAIATRAGLTTIVDLTDDTTRVLRPASGDMVGVLAVSGDETYLVAGTSGGRLELWDLQRGVQEALFCGAEAWGAVWVSDRAERIVAGDALGGVHFLVRDV
jgi:WD40 repeat protein